MGNCCKPFGLVRRYSNRLRQRKIVLLLVGLDNAGKSSTAKGLLKEPVDNLLPTVGFDVVKLFHKGYSVIIYDLGGGVQIRDIWKQYFVDVHGVIFVVDSSDHARLDECKKVFEDLLIDEHLSGKPILLLANKQDKYGALDELDIVERLNVERLVNMQQCPTLVETCSAAPPVENCRKRSIDPGINNGYRWLLRRIIRDYDILNRRVMADQEIQRITVHKERESLRKRLEMLKENNQIEEDEDEYDMANGANPFQPIQVLVKEIERREEIQCRVDISDKLNSVTDPGDNVRPISNNKQNEVIELQPNKKPTNENSEPSAMDIVKEQLRSKSASQLKKRQLLKRSNRTAPINDVEIPERRVCSAEFKKKTNVLPPIKHTGSSLSWALVSNGKTQNGHPWALNQGLDMTLPNCIETVHQKTGGSDADDVMVKTLR